jgi:hypothetical protein
LLKFYKFHTCTPEYRVTCIWVEWAIDTFTSLFLFRSKFATQSNILLQTDSADISANDQMKCMEIWKTGIIICCVDSQFRTIPEKFETAKKKLASHISCTFHDNICIVNLFFVLLSIFNIMYKYHMGSMNRTHTTKSVKNWSAIHQLLNIILQLRILVLLLVSTLPYVV